MPEPIMPPPGIIATTCDEADRPRNLKSQHIQPIPVVGNPCQQPALMITDLQDTILDVNLGPDLIELRSFRV
jgi:hypothetical protein